MLYLLCESDQLQSIVYSSFLPAILIQVTGKKHFAKNAIISRVQEARVCLHVNIAIYTLNTKLIWVD